MAALTTRLNIACTCTECSAFLHPTHSASAMGLAPLLTGIVVAPQPWIDKSSPSTYPVLHTLGPISTLPSPSPLHSLRVATSIASSPLFSPTANSSPSAFPKTPGALRCSYPACRARIPRQTRLAVQHIIPLREEHSEVFFDAQEQLGDLDTDALPVTKKTASRMGEPSIKPALGCSPDKQPRQVTGAFPV